MRDAATVVPPEHVVDGPITDLSSLRQGSPTASLTGTLRSDRPPPISAALAHVLAMSRAASARLAKIPHISIDESTFVSSRRCCQE
jgi:hypothetical protein